MKMAILYTVLAIIATITNIATQEISTRIYSAAFSTVISIAAGTGAGLVTKYILDKRYIFQFQARDTLHDSQTFALYTLMGIVTTIIFWGFELGFNHLFDSKEMRYLGGIIGLSIGYLIKYQLDKRFVFQTKSQ